MFRNLLMAAATTVAVTMAAPASAAEHNRISMSELTGILQNAGLTAAATSNSEIIQVGQSFIWLTDCGADGRCAEVSFFRNYGDVFPTLQAVNTWNNTRKLPEASLNSDGTLHMEMWLSAVGTTDTVIVDSLGWFERYVADTEFWGPFIRQASI